MKIRLALLAVSLLQVAVVIFVIAKSTDEEWRDYQLDYYDQAMGAAANTAAKEALADSGLEIKQDRLTGFGEETRIDRCRTCHAAIDDPKFVSGTEPLRQHPDVPGHPFSEFGCTICHEGNGRALSTYYAHGEDHFWPEPLLPMPYMEASCARCHPEPYLDEMPHIRRGRLLFDRYTCSGCHTIRGVSRGKLGPDLTDVGQRWGLDYLHESIVTPKANAAMSIMPTFNMSERDRIDLVVFLKSQRGRTLVEDPISLRVSTKEWKEQQPPELEVSVEAGRRAVEERSCVSCHKLGDEDGGLAPDLSFNGLLQKPQYVVKHLVDPRSHTTGSNMPNFWMSQSEREAIALYLSSLDQVTVPDTPAEQYTKFCARCHGKDGAGDGVAADNLLPRPREFTNAKFFNWLPEARAYDAISHGVPGTAMPPFGAILDRSQVEALFGYVRKSFVKAEREVRNKPRTVPDHNPRPYNEDSVAAGRAAFAQRCYGCHGRRGDGKGPNAPDLVPRPRDLTSTAFFTPLADTRLFESITYGVVGTGMPAWDYLPETQRWDLVNFVRSISQTGAGAPRN